MIEMTAAPTHPPWRNAGIVPRTQGIDPALIQPLPGQLYHLSGPGRSGKSMRGVAEHWVAQALAEGRVVHWGGRGVQNRSCPVYPAA